MAAQAESDQIIFQKMLSSGGSVRIVTIDTSFLHRIMFEFRLDDSILNILMAIEAEIITRFQKNKLIFRSMRVVTFYAIAFYYHFMTAFGTLGDDSFMTLVTDLVGVFVQQLPVRRGMRVMTF
jgi:hypothetical protein